MKEEVDTREFAEILIMLAPDKCLDFFSDEDELYGAVQLHHFETRIIYLNYYGGGKPYVIDIGCDSSIEYVVNAVEQYKEYEGINRLFVKSTSTTRPVG